MKVFKNRQQAGEALAQQLLAHKFEHEVIVLGLARGGIPVAAPIAQTLNTSLDAFLVRKIGMPLNPELALGAVAQGDVIVWNDNLMPYAHLTENEISERVKAQQYVINDYNQRYRQGRPKPEIADKTVIIVDDGLATGATMRAAISALKVQQPASIIVAVPVGAPDIIADIARMVDDCICLLQPEDLGSVGAWYQDFEQVSDAQVTALLT
ncbi:MAG: phosphoribosyltransferase [Gammaproteobacteria bacterium]